MAVKNDAQGKDHQAYVDEFCLRGTEALGRHLLGTMEVGATGIAIEVNRSLYPPPPPEEPPELPREHRPRSLWEVLFG